MIVGWPTLLELQWVPNLARSVQSTKRNESYNVKWNGTFRFRPTYRRIPSQRTAFVYILLQPFRYRHAGFDGRNKKMSRQTRFPYCMTLRLTTPMQSEVENLAYDSQLSQAQFIRRCIRQAIVDAYDHRTPSKTSQIHGGAL